MFAPTLSEHERTLHCRNPVRERRATLSLRALPVRGRNALGAPRAVPSLYSSGALKSEGTYQHGLESGEWLDFHANGQLAALGQYEDGVEVGDWKFWDANGKQEEGVTY